MKIQSIELKYFKRFGQPPVFDFTDAETGLAKDLIVSKNQYEIYEMSGGERAVFPMVMDFASWNIHNSVILIDEI